MHGNHQHGPKSRSYPSATSRSESPLGMANGDMVANSYFHSSRFYQHTSQTDKHRTSKFPMVNSNQGQPYVGGSGMWQHLMVGAVGTDAIKCIKYCLSWIQYAEKHIKQQMGLLRAFLVSLAASSSSSSSAGRVLSMVKKQLVDTLRKVVDVISSYAGISLPYQAKMAVRGFILNLPSRWASLNDCQSTSSTANLPVTSTSTLKDKSSNGETTMAAAAVVRLLNFGQESLDMLQSITGVFSCTEAWLDRLYICGNHYPRNMTIHPFH